MKQWMAIAVLAATPAVAVAPADVDLNGAWALSGDVQGVSVVETCNFVQKDAVLTGSCDTSTGKYDTAGKVNGTNVTFHHGGKYEGSDLTITYTGKVAADGSMSGTMDVDPFNASGSFSAKKGPVAQ